MSFSIEQADFDDLPSILSLQILAFQQEVQRYGDPELPPVKQTLFSIRQDWEKGLFFILKEKGQILGSVRALIGGDLCRIARLFVHPDYQGKGHGRRLMEALEKACLQNNLFNSFEIFTGSLSLETMGLYRSLGYRIREEQPAGSGQNQYQLVFMEKSREAALTSYSYDDSALAYENRFSRFEEYRNRIIRFAKAFTAGDRLLDLGCGPGQNSRIFADFGLKVQGLDLSREMIARARENCPEGEFRVGSAGSIPWEGPFQGICLAFLIVHLKDKETASLIGRLPELLQPGSRVYISFMSGKQPGLETTSFSSQPIYFNYYNSTWINALMEGCGFLLIREETAPYREEDGSSTADHFLEYLYSGDDD